MFAQEGGAKVKGLTFRNGTVEFDVDPAAMGAGLAFRMQGLQNLETLDFRPQPELRDSAWDCIVRALHPRGPALGHVPAVPGAGAAARGRVEPRQARDLRAPDACVHQRRNLADAESRQARRRYAGGRICLLEARDTFANLTVAPDAVEGLAATPEKIRRRRNAASFATGKSRRFRELPDGKEPTIADAHAAADWRRLAAERGGLVNISRVYGLPLSWPRRR